jgi:nitrate reductase alpha subunit
VKYPYVRGSLLEMWREARTRHADAVDAWATIVEDPVKSRTYKLQRGKGGLVRSSWDEVTEMIAAAHVYTIKRYGPDRVAGFSPIPAMSMVSYSAETRFLSLIGGTILSFYDWYADLPPASPQVWGDQTDVPESGDWWNAGYLIVWGTNLPITRTPDAHFMTEARYKGQKVVVVSPDYSDHTKFADTWLAAQPGTDGALAMAMGHVILKEFYVDRQVPYFQQYARQYTDLPLLVALRERGDSYVPDRFLRASDLGEGSENAEWKTVVLDEATGRTAVPNGSIGYRYGASGMGKWNLELGGIKPALSLYGRRGPVVTIELPRFDAEHTAGDETQQRGIPTMRIGDHLVTTVYDLTLAQYGVVRDGLPGEWPAARGGSLLLLTELCEPAGSGPGLLERLCHEVFGLAVDLRHDGVKPLQFPSIGSVLEDGRVGLRCGQSLAGAEIENGIGLPVVSGCSAIDGPAGQGVDPATVERACRRAQPGTGEGGQRRSRPRGECVLQPPSRGILLLTGP